MAVGGYADERVAHVFNQSQGIKVGHNIIYMTYSIYKGALATWLTCHGDAKPFN